MNGDPPGVNDHHDRNRQPICPKRGLPGWRGTGNKDGCRWCRRVGDWHQDGDPLLGESWP